MKYNQYAIKNNKGESEMTNKFMYNGLAFEPLKNLEGNAANFEAISKRIRDIGITPDEWDYDEFYDVAKKNNAVVDLYKVGDYTVIPARNHLFKYEG